MEQQKHQDKIAEDMIEAARGMKETSLLARSLIRNDNNVLIFIFNNHRPKKSVTL
jgi:hypothetical protein